MEKRIEIERRNRIRASLGAYAYEIMDDPIFSDAEYDAICLKIQPEVDTGHEVMDDFFRTEFSPDTGMWINRHPEWQDIARIYRNLTGKQPRHITKPSAEKLPATIQSVNQTGSHMDMKFYLARLGFSMVPHFTITPNGDCLQWNLDGDGIEVINLSTKEQRKVLWNDFDASEAN